MNEAKKVNCFKGLDSKRLHMNFESLEWRWFQTKIFELLLEKEGIGNALNRSVRVQTATKNVSSLSELANEFDNFQSQ